MQHRLCEAIFKVQAAWFPVRTLRGWLRKELAGHIMLACNKTVPIAVSDSMGGKDLK